VPLGVLDTLRRRGNDAPATFGWWRGPNGTVEGAFLHTRPHPMLLTSMPGPAACELAELLSRDRAPLPGIRADQAVSRAFATTWTHRTGTASRVDMRQRLYRLDRLRPPAPLPQGTPRVATDRDRDLVLAWNQAFHDHAGIPASASTAEVDDRLGHDGITLWDVDGTPVSMAARSRAMVGVARVANVYTPPEHRRHGFAAAVTAAITRTALNAGAHDVVLFTDLANPTSNDIYQRLGYRPVSDALVLTFTP
jgi:predicted GNAT family acetyltransferase